MVLIYHSGRVIGVIGTSRGGMTPSYRLYPTSSTYLRLIDKIGQPRIHPILVPSANSNLEGT